MAQWLRTLTALPEDPDSIPSNHMAAHNLTTVWISSSRGSDTHGKTPMYIKKKKKKRKEKKKKEYGPGMESGEKNSECL